MFSSLRSNRFGVPGVISVIALVFAMAGGAYAAKKYAITSTSQIKPSVLKSLQGKAGAPGANGAAGPQGPAGAKGETGAAGAIGAAGIAGAAGVTGATGPTGKEGSPWTQLGTLPSEETETGAWSYNSDTAGEEELYIAISFPISLPEALPSTSVHFLAEGEGGTADCPGTVASPEAEPGHLCVYSKILIGVGASKFIVDPGTIGVGAASSGALLNISMAPGGGVGFGTWAVTAE
jgi:hypothetical protein